jgi:hypothetical protein
MASHGHSHNHLHDDHDDSIKVEVDPTSSHVHGPDCQHQHQQHGTHPGQGAGQRQRGGHQPGCIGLGSSWTATLLIVATSSLVEAIAAVSTLPLERSKLLGQTLSPQYVGVFAMTLLGASPSNGWWTAIEAVALRAAIMSIVRIMLQPLAALVAQHNQNAADRLLTARTVLAIVCTLTLYPLDTMVTRMLADTDGFFTSLVVSMQRTYDTSGLYGFTRGGLLAIYCSSLHVVVVFRIGQVMFERLSHHLPRDALQSSWLGPVLSLCGLIVAEFVTVPLDTITRRLQTASPIACASMWSCLGAAWDMPLWWLWSGLVVALARIVLFTLIRNLGFIAARPILQRIIPRGAAVSDSLPIHI